MPASSTSKQRDPVSVLFDAAARAHLAAAYAEPGRWIARPLLPPTGEHRLWALGLGINLDAADPAKAAVGTSMNRWDAAFQRAVYWLHRWYWDGGQGFRDERRNQPAPARAVQVSVAARARRFQLGPRSFYARPARVRVLTGGRRALAHVQQLADAARIYDDAGEPAGKWGDPATRDWE
jgi:hypothetical protein